MAWDGKIPFHPLTGEVMDYEHTVYSLVHPVHKYPLVEGTHYKWEWEQGYYDFCDLDVRDMFSKERPRRQPIPIVWKDNYVFTTTMRIIGMERGRSAARFTLQDQHTDREYTIFMKDMLDMLRMAVVRKGFVGGDWTFVKRGTNFGISYIKSYE